MNRLLLLVLVSGFCCTGALADPADDSLAAAFLAQCQRMQACLNEEMLARPDMDPAIAEMIQTRMTGQCEAQLPRIAQLENLPHAVDMKSCYRALAALTCEALKAEPQLPECDF